MAEINHIITSLEQQLAAVERALSALRSVAGIAGSEANTPRRRGRPPGSKSDTAGQKRVLSPEGRQRIIEATRRRWAAARKAQKQAPAQKRTPAKRGGMTAAGRKRLSELTKARWASKNPPKPVARKKS